MLLVVGAALAGTVWGHRVTGRVLLLSACRRDCAVAASAPAASRRLDASRSGTAQPLGILRYRWITMQVRVRVTPSTTWMREATSRPT